MRDWKRFPDSRAAALVSRGLRGGIVMTKRGRKRHQGALAQLVARFHGMEEVRGSSPLSSTIKPLVRPPFVVREAFWLVCLAFAYQSAYQCVRTLIVGEEHIHRDGSAGQHRT